MRTSRSSSGTSLRYVRVPLHGDLPALDEAAPFRAMIACESQPDEARRLAICGWLVDATCRYLVPHGADGDAWCQSMREANLARYDLDTMSPADFVVTVSHPHDSLKSVVWFAKKMAKHPHHAFDGLVLVHVASESRPAEFRTLYEKA